MVEKVKKAITKQLGATFGNSYRYYTEDVEQEFKKPSFFVMMRRPTQRATSPVLYNRTFPIVVHYFSDSKNNVNSDSYEMAEQIVECLEHLPIDSTFIRAEQVSWNIIEGGVLQVHLTYSFLTQRVLNNGENMGELTEKVAHS